MRHCKLIVALVAGLIPVLFFGVSDANAVAEKSSGISLSKTSDLLLRDGVTSGPELRAVFSAGNPADLYDRALAVLDDVSSRVNAVACAYLREIAYGEVNEQNQDIDLALKLSAELPIRYCWISGLIALDMRTLRDGHKPPVDRVDHAIFKAAVYLFYKQDWGYRAKDRIDFAKNLPDVRARIGGMPPRLMGYLRRASEMRARVVTLVEEAPVCDVLARGLDYWYGDAGLPRDRQLGEFFVDWARFQSKWDFYSRSPSDEQYFHTLLFPSFEIMDDPLNDYKSSWDPDPLQSYEMFKALAHWGNPFAAKRLGEIEAFYGNHSEARRYFAIASFSPDMDVAHELQDAAQASGMPITAEFLDTLRHDATPYYEKACFGRSGRFSL